MRFMPIFPRGFSNLGDFIFMDLHKAKIGHFSAGGLSAIPWVDAVSTELG